MNATTTLTRTPYWARFAAHDLLDVDWSDHDAAHRGVMRLFRPRLDGDPNRRRETAGILFRLEPGPDGDIVLVQSAVLFDLLPSAAQAKSVPPAAWEIQTGSLVRLRAAVNPIRRHRDKVTVVPETETSVWLDARLAHCLAHLEIITQWRRTCVTRNKRKAAVPARLVVETLDCVATVTDGDAFEMVRREGLGRGRAYGCGLVTAQRIGRQSG